MKPNMDIFGRGQIRDALGNRQAAWPTTRAERGKYYLLPDPVHSGDQLVVMSYDTWADFGTQLEIARRAGVEMNTRIKELVGDKLIITAQAAQYKDKLEAVQALRRKEKLNKVYASHGVVHDKPD
jgi:hypothetical protein